MSRGYKDDGGLPTRALCSRDVSSLASFPLQDKSQVPLQVLLSIYTSNSHFCSRN